MAIFEIKMPKLGESITEATITRWLKNPGDSIELDDAIVEIATDKVDSEIPSPVEGILKKQLFAEGDTVAVDTVIALIATEGEGEGEGAEEEKNDSVSEPGNIAEKTEEKPESTSEETIRSGEGGRFYSPLVRNIARKEGVSASELETIKGSGQDGRLTKNDLMAWLNSRGKQSSAEKPATTTSKSPVDVSTVITSAESPAAPAKKPEVSPAQGDEIIEMDRMRKLIAEHMIMSEATSVHITLFLEADMSRLVNWRNKQKDVMLKRDNEKLTFTPLFIEAVSRALRDFPMVNVSVDGDKIIKRKSINVGMAAALPNGNLIVPVIKNADHKSLLGLAREVNDLANRARQNQLKPDEIQGGTFTITNFGTFGASMGTPIINQPQVAILGVGLIQKRPVVVESAEGDSIAIRHRMYLSLSCDHRVVDGALGGMFLRRVADYLENFDTSRNV